MSGAVSSHCHGHIDNLQLLDREATLLGTGKCPLYNYDSGMNRAAREGQGVEGRGVTSPSTPSPPGAWHLELEDITMASPEVAGAVFW